MPIPVATTELASMARTRERVKGRKVSGRFVALPHCVLEHSDFASLSYNARALLLELALQYNGHNNGDLTAAWSIIGPRGWRSKTTLQKAINELLEKGFIIKTRDGWFQNPGARCNLYALTWKPIDECPKKNLNINSTQMPPRAFTAKH